MKPRVKICCIGSEEEADLAIACGASALGLVGQMPSGPGIISDEMIGQIASKTPPGISSFLLTSETQTREIIAHHQRVHTSVIQLVDALSDGSYQTLREALPGVKLVQVIHVIHEGSLEEALKVAPFVDAILLDSGNPNLLVKELGGTGRVHNWEISRRIRKQVGIPVFLAGGLNPENVQEAIEKVEPFGLDICSGIRTQGQLDPYKTERFFDVIDRL